jgi:hypothetical protein
MPKSRVAAIVCEGQTDVPILRAIIMSIWPDIGEVRCLQPEIDETGRAKTAAGWTQVKRWCETCASDLPDVLNPDVGDPIDLLVIAMDVDIAIQAGIANPPQRVGIYETQRLRDTIAGWLTTQGRSKLPGAVVISTPVRAVEAWVVAALFKKECSPEQIPDPAAFLVAKQKLRVSNGKAWKELHRYRDFADMVGKKTGQVRKTCREADRMMCAIERCRASNAKVRVT